MSMSDSAMRRSLRRGRTRAYAKLDEAIVDLDGVAVGFNGYMVVVVRSIDGAGFLVSGVVA
jgi:hypothetical protein